jgi:hypothetical protein
MMGEATVADARWSLLMPQERKEPGILGTPPGPGAVGLLVTAREMTAAQLVAALTQAGGPVEALGVLVNGQWRLYLNGAPVVVNENFPTVLPPLTVFFVRMKRAQQVLVA